MTKWDSIVIILAITMPLIASLLITILAYSLVGSTISDIIFTSITYGMFMCTVLYLSISTLRDITRSY